MDNKITVSVELAKAVSESRGLYNEIKGQGGFKGEKGSVAGIKNEKILQQLETGVKDGVTPEEYKNFKKQLKELIASLVTYSGTLKTLSNEAIKQKESLDKLNAKRDAAEDKNNKAIRDEADARKALVTALGGREIHPINKNGELYKGDPWGADAIARNIDKKQFGYKGDDGKVHTFSPDQINKAKDLQTKQSDKEIATSNLKAMNRAVKDATEKLKALANVPLLNKALDLQTTTGQTISGEEKKAAETYANNQGTGNPVNNQVQPNGFNKMLKQATLYHFALRYIRMAGREAIRTIKELDKSLTEQAMVTGMTRQETYKLLRSYQDLAGQLGATTKEVASVATEYMKQGKTISESLTLSEAAIAAAKVARVSVSDSVNYLTTALNGFRLSADQAMAVSDKFAAVAAASATDYDELAIALSKVASQANLAGMSIDYTTALLTKGLETTREAPETMGTALKTIIARMREIKDYGETLEGDADVNNVESQLSYVGIALKDANGELRSTEEVLDELGRKWSTLSKNQQAALAKALAGTRQQSRLIAMMDGYDRVIELNEIAQRSAGATSAQMATYMESLDAAFNKVKTSWEKVVSTMVNNEFIIGIVNTVSNLLNMLNGIAQTTTGMLSIWVVLGSIAVNIVASKLLEHQLNKENYKIALQEQRTNLDKYKISLKEKREAAITRYNALKTLDTKKETYITQLKSLKADAEANKNTILAAKYEADIALAEKDQFNIAKEQALAKAEVRQIDQEILFTDAQITMNKGQQVAAQSGLLGLAGKMITPLLSILTIGRLTWGILKSSWNWKKKELIVEAASTEEKKKGALANIAAHAPWYIALAALALLGIGITAIHAYKKANEDDQPTKTAKAISKISNEIYKLNERSQNLKNIQNDFETLDNKVIKTNADIKEMNSLLNKASEQLSDEIGEKENQGYGIGVSERAYFEMQTTQVQKNRALVDIRKQQKEKIEEWRKEIKKELDKTGLSVEELTNENTQDKNIQLFQAAMYKENNMALYDAIDNLKEINGLTNEESNSLQVLTQNLLENLSAQEAMELLDNSEKIDAIIAKLSETTLKVKDLNGELENKTVSEIFSSDAYSLREKVDAYRAILDTLPSDMRNTFKKAYSEYAFFADNIKGSKTYDFLDSEGISIDKINQISQAWGVFKKAGIDITKEEFMNKIPEFLNNWAESEGDLELAITKTFTTIKAGSELYDTVVTTISNITSENILNIGQNVDTFKNKINSFYETFKKWNTLSETDRTKFIEDNKKLFEGESGEKLLQAFNTSDLDTAKELLENDPQLQKMLARNKATIDRTLENELAKGDKADQVLIKQLREYQKYFDDVDSLFEASLDFRLEKEKQELEAFKKLKEEERDATIKTLEDRKKAYEDYFSTINKEESQEEYEEKANLLATNINKLASSSSSEAQQKRMNLVTELKDLQKDRLKELREEAQQALVENIDKEIEETNETLDKLLESNRALLAAMTGELKEDPLGFLSDVISSKITEGLSATELEKTLSDLQSIYGSHISGSLEDLNIEEKNGNLILNINDQEVVLNTDDQQSLAATIKKALRSIGHNVGHGY